MFERQTENGPWRQNAVGGAVRGMCGGHGALRRTNACASSSPVASSTLQCRLPLERHVRGTHTRPLPVADYRHMVVCISQQHGASLVIHQYSGVLTPRYNADSACNRLILCRALTNAGLVDFVVAWRDSPARLPFSRRHMRTRSSTPWD